MHTQKFIHFDVKTGQLFCRNTWNLSQFNQIQRELNQTHWPKQGTVIIDGQEIKRMDSAGSWALVRSISHLHQIGLQTELANFSNQNQRLIDMLIKTQPSLRAILPSKQLNSIASLGRYSLELLYEFIQYLSFVGHLAYEFLQSVVQPRTWRWNSLANTIIRTGCQALPIIALLSFMIGVVISYQMGNQLRAYGANVFIVDLLGLSVLREFGPLITAIMVAGRTGSAFTAQLGIMKINQEIDALNTMGILPGTLLLLPRLLGLCITLPLLTIWANVFGIFGGMIMANNMLDISWYEFLERFQHEIPLRALLIGLGKAPVFALIIGSIGCFQGMQVKGSAESVGLLTTRSVVLAIFFIIVIDAIFSVIFSKLQL